MSDLSEQQVMMADAAEGGRQNEEEQRRSKVREKVQALLGKVSEEDRILLCRFEFVREGRPVVLWAAPGGGVEAGEPPEALADGTADVGALAAEFVLLGIDPYPRKPGAEFTPPPEDSATATPFAALSKLKDAKN